MRNMLKTMKSHLENGEDLVLGENDALPALTGKTVSGELELAPGSCAFFLAEVTWYRAA